MTVIFDDTTQQSLSNLNVAIQSGADRSRQLSQVFRHHGAGGGGGLHNQMMIESQSMAGVSTLGTKRFASVKGGVAISELLTNHNTGEHPGFDATTNNSMNALSYSKSQ